MWGMGGWTGSDDAESLASLQRAVDLGCNFFDTAWGYGAGHSEGLLGQMVRANPDKQLYTATKIPPKNFKWPSRREFTLDDCFPPDHIEEYVHKSLKNAGLESFDLMQFHTWEDSWVQDDRWAKKMDELRSQGLIRAVGISLNRWEPWNGVQAVRSGLIDAVQVIYNIFDQNPEDELFPACRGDGRRRDRARAVRRGHADRHADQGQQVARRATGATPTLCRRTSAPASTAPSAEAASLPAGHDHAGDGAALHPEQPDRQHHHPRHAQGAPRGGEHRRLRRRPAARGTPRPTAPYRWDRQPTEWSQ